MPLNDVASTGGGGGIYPENGTKHKAQGMAKPPDSSGSGLSLFALQNQKWQQVFDLDKVIKQLRTAEKTFLRGGKNSSSAAAGGDQQAKVQVQRLQSADMAYYDLVPKLASRDIVLCSSCSGCYTKAGFQHHIALQHPSVWEATSSKVNASANGAATSSHDSRLTATENSQEGVVPSSPTDTLSASTLSSCSNGSSSSTSLQHPAAGAGSSSTTTSSSSSSSSRHKSSSSKSSSSSTSKGSSSGGTSAGSRSRSKSSKNRHHSSPAPAPALESNHKESSKGSKKSTAIAAPQPVVAAAAAVKEEPPAAAVAAPAAITVFSSSSNSSCSLPPTPTLGAASGEVVNYSPAQLQTEVEKLPELQPKKKLKGSSDHRTKAEKEKNKEKPAAVVVNPYEQQQQVISELDQAVSSITGAVSAEQVATEEEELPLPNTSDENSISQTLDEMLDSKLINEILNNFDESALDTSQQQQQPQQQQSQNGNLSHPAQATKRLRYEDGTIGEDYTVYQQQSVQQVYGQEEEHQQQELTTIDAMQLQQLIYQQQQMLEQQQLQEQQQQQQQQDQKLQDHEQQRQFSVYNVPSLTDEAMANPQQPQQLEEHMILPSIIYEISESNPVSMLEQQKVLAEFLTHAGYENVDVNVVQTGDAMETTTTNHLADELGDFEFSKLETVSDTVKTVKLEAKAASQITHHPSLANAKYHEDSYFNVMLYSGSPRPLAMNTFGMVKMPQGLGVTFRKNLLTTRKANNSLLSLTGGGTHLGVVGQLARPPPPPSPALSNGFPGKNPASGRTIYAQRSNVIAQDRLRCNKRALISGKGVTGAPGVMTAKRLNELLMGKVKKEEKPQTEGEEGGEQPPPLKDKEREKEEDNKLTFSFFEKRRRLLAGKQEQLPQLGRPSFHLPLQSNHNASQSQSHSPQQQLLKKQLLRTLSDSSSNINISNMNNINSNMNSSSNNNTPSANSNPPWKGNNSNPGGNSTPTSSDLMRVFV